MFSKTLNFWITFFTFFFKCHFKKRKKSRFFGFSKKNVKRYSRTMPRRDGRQGKQHDAAVNFDLSV